MGALVTKGLLFMKYGYLTPEERAANAEELAKIKELLIKWLKKVPADKFDNERIEAVLFCNDEPSWRYKERYWKTCYLRAIRETTHIYELVKLLYKLPQYGEDLLALFLCTRLAMKNWQVTQSLIEFIDDDDAEFGISLIYMQFEMGKTIKTVQHFTEGMEFNGIEFRKLAPEDHLVISEAQINYYDHIRLRRRLE